MSTILDALRKIEGERHGQGGEVRARVLAGPPRPLSPAPPHRSRLWAAGMSFLLVGFAVGVWMTRQEAVPPEEGETPPVRPPKEAERRPPLPAIPENFEESEKTVSAVVEGQIQEEQKRIGSVTDPPTPEYPLALSEPPPLQDSPFVSSTQVALRASLVDATPQRFSETSGEKTNHAPQRRGDSALHISETAGEGLETTLESGHEKQGGREKGGEAERFEQEQPLVPRELADMAEPDESEDVYAPAPANSAISFLQWSPESARRKAFVRVGGSPLTLVHEGDAIGGYTVVEIRPNAVALRSGATRFQLRVR